MSLCIFSFLTIIVLLFSKSLDNTSRKIHTWFRHIEIIIPKRIAICVLVLFLFAIVFRLGQSFFMPHPEPRVHDEFSYLLQAETFADGRLTNPTPNCWQAMQTFHIFMTPTYCSKYPPAQAAFLAIGVALFSDPWYGVLISYALMCALVYWGLVQFLPSRWAFVGYLTCLATFSGTNYWSNSYWGGAVAACGGALVFGSIKLIWNNPTIRSTILFVLGIAILFFSRPFEGGIFALPAILFVVWKLIIMVRNKQTAIATRVFICLAVGAVIIVGFCLYYNSKTTGDWKTLPYQAHEKQYARQSPFVWNSILPPKKLDYPELEDYHNKWSVDHAWKPFHNDNILDSISTLCKRIVKDITIIPTVQSRLLCAILMVLGILTACKIKKYYLLLWAGLSIVVTLISSHYHMHYYAPFLILMFYILILGIRSLLGIKYIPKHARRPLCLMVVLSILAFYPLLTFYECIIGQKPDRFSLNRHKVIELVTSGNATKHLILVQYSKHHNIHIEWVYNSPNPSQARIVWLRYSSDIIGQARRCYPGRAMWLLKADMNPPKLSRIFIDSDE